MKAQHGYDETQQEMKSFFGIWGTGIKKNYDIGEMELIHVAPSLASIMGFHISNADGKNAL